MKKHRTSRDALGVAFLALYRYRITGEILASEAATRNSQKVLVFLKVAAGYVKGVNPSFSLLCSFSILAIEFLLFNSEKRTFIPFETGGARDDSEAAKKPSYFLTSPAALFVLFPWT